MTTKYLLREDQIPRSWYNVLADLKTPPAPVLHPQTRKPVGPQDLAPLFPMAIIEQEVSTRREVPIPDEVRDALAAAEAATGRGLWAAGMCSYEAAPGLDPSLVVRTRRAGDPFE
ncbi:MAG TPA: hypothetical protein VMK66_17930, partial [Myxococcales bacterium]|nr:hypothetical protein [Myxococcales bacterium]